MRKMLAGGLAILLLLLSGVTTAFAADNTEETLSGIAYTELEKEIDKYIDVRKDTTSSVSIAYFNETENIASVIYGKQAYYDITGKKTYEDIEEEKMIKELGIKADVNNDN